MEFTWNEEKNKENMQKHGVDFREVQEIFDDPFHFSIMDTRFNYFEERWITIGRTKNGLTIVAGHLYLFNEKGTETIRLITARKQPGKRGKIMNTSEDKENFELQAEYDFSKGIRGRFYRPKKISTTIRIDDDVVLYFKKLATEKKVAYQTLMNDALRGYLKALSR